MSFKDVTVSAKIPESLRDRIDDIGKERGIRNRSVLLRKALEAFVEKHEESGIPTKETKIGDGEGEIIRLKGTCGIPQRRGDSISGNRGGGKRG